MRGLMLAEVVLLGFLVFLLLLGAPGCGEGSKADFVGGPDIPGQIEAASGETPDTGEPYVDPMLEAERLRERFRGGSDGTL